MPADELRDVDIARAALEVEDGPARQAYLDDACRGDAALRRAVEGLLHVQPFDGTRDHRAGPDLTSADETPAVPPPNAAEAVGSRIGPYKLLQPIGEGGMGVVYLAEQEQPVRRRVALKIIKPGMDSNQIIARFSAERQALALMDHVNIAKVFDAGATDAGRPYFVMELVQGVSITRYCDDNHLTPRQRLELFVPVCQAIQHAHQKGIIHRDIKPSNVLVTLYDGKPTPKVIDFGVAKATEQALTEKTMFTQFGTMVGTLEYMSPEQAEMSMLGVDTRSDVYSLGVLLYELLTGTTPLSRKRLRSAAFDEVLRLIREEEPSKPSTRLSESGEQLASISARRKTEPAKLSRLLRGELDWIVMKALEKDRTRRYETANGFAKDVQRYLADEPVEACPPSTSYRLRKFLRKHRKGIAAAVVLGVLLTAAAGLSSWLAYRATKAEEAAVEDRNRARQSDLEAREDRDRLASEKKRADENFALARSAVEDYLNRVTDDPDLKDRTDLTSLRKRLLESALPFYEKLGAQAGADVQSRAEKGKTLQRLAEVQLDSGSHADAVKTLLQAKEVYAQVVADAPETFIHRSRLVDALDQLAYWEMRTQNAAASAQDKAEALRQADRLVADFPNEPDARFVRCNVLMDLEPKTNDVALRGLRDLVREFPEDGRYATMLAGALDNAAGLAFGAGKTAAADAMYQEELAIDRKLLVAKPDDPARRHYAANALFNYGAFLHNLKRPAEALPLRQEASALLRRLVQDFSSNLRYRHMLARNQNAVGLLLADSRKPVEAIEPLREAVLLMDQLPENYPSPTVHRWRTADFTNHLAVVLDTLDQWDEASVLLEKALRLLTAPPSNFNDPQFEAIASPTLSQSLRVLLRGGARRDRSNEARKKIDELRAELRARKDAETLIVVALATVGEGLHLAAIEDAETVVALRPQASGPIYNAACVLSLASAKVNGNADLSERLAARAVEWLQRSVAAGLREPQNMKNDPDFVPLHDRADYKKVVDELP